MGGRGRHIKTVFTSLIRSQVFTVMGMRVNVNCMQIKRYKTQLGAYCKKKKKERHDVCTIRHAFFSLHAPFLSFAGTQAELFCFYSMHFIGRVWARSAKMGAEGVWSLALLSLWGPMRAGSQLGQAAQRLTGMSHISKLSIIWATEQRKTSTSESVKTHGHCVHNCQQLHHLLCHDLNNNLLVPKPGSSVIHNNDNLSQKYLRYCKETIIITITWIHKGLQ